MRPEIPRSMFYHLSAEQMAVANAMANRARCAAWIRRARLAPAELRAMYVAFASSAQRAFLNDMRRAYEITKGPTCVSLSVFPAGMPSTPASDTSSASVNVVSFSGRRTPAASSATSASPTEGALDGH